MAYPQLAGARLGLAAVLFAALAVLISGCSAGAPAAAPRDDTGSAGPHIGGNDDGEPAEQVADGTLVVRTGRLSLEVSDLGAAVDAGARTAAGLGGYIGRSEESHSSSGGWASVTYRLPVERWDEALTAFRGLGRVLDQDTEALDVTAQVVDLDARLTNLRATEAALQQIMERATTITDVLKVQDELSGVRGDIERLTAERGNLAQRAAMATLTVNYNTPTVAVTQATEAWDPAREIDAAFASLLVIGQRLASLAIWLTIVVLPVVVPVLLIGWVVYRIVRARQPSAPMQPSDPPG
jgi:hypothetical protein